MSTTSLRRCLGLVLLALGAILAVTTSCADTTLPPKGQLMLVITTNLAPPKDFDTLHVRIVAEGATVPAHDVDYALDGSQAVKLPATLGVLGGADPSKSVRITVEARRAGVVRITREAVARVPLDRIASLPLPVDGLCIDRACPSDASGNVQTCIAGTCQTAIVDTEMLPLFDEGAVFGGGTGHGDGACFDTIACFTNGKQASVRASDCSIEREDLHSGFGLNVAVVRPAGSDGICAANACLVPIERDALAGPIVTGWREVGDRAVLPPVVCELSLPIFVTTTCPTKDAPTCGPWSATGATRDLGDASFPVDATGLVVGDGGASPFPKAVRFLDEDPRLGFVSGTVTIERATDERTVTAYKLYWADGPTKKLDLIATLPKTGADVTHTLSGPVAPGATYLLAFSVTASGELVPAVSTGPVDNHPGSTHLTTSGVDIDRPTVLVDSKAEKLLIVGFDKNPARMVPGMVRCNLDRSGCTYVDISAGEPTQTDSQMGAAIDEVHQKLYVATDNVTGAGLPRLLVCNTDGTGCIASNLGNTLHGSQTGCRVPVLLDSVNQKVLAILTLGGATSTTLVRCGLDGQGCTNQVISTNSFACPNALISPDGKLLVVQRGSALGPRLQRCELDGTNCQPMEIRGMRTADLSELSAAIDTVNQKLLVVGENTNDLVSSFYRCNLDGTGCVGSDLGVKDDAFGYPTQPSVVVDAPHQRLFVFGYSAGNSGGFYQRCNLDGTGCTFTATGPAGVFAGTHPHAILFAGKLYSASRPGSSGATGIDLISLSSY
jgi:hypothetical protein